MPAHCLDQCAMSSQQKQAREPNEDHHRCPCPDRPRCQTHNRRPLIPYALRSVGWGRTAGRHPLASLPRARCAASCCTKNRVSRPHSLWSKQRKSKTNFHSKVFDHNGQNRRTTGKRTPRVAQELSCPHMNEGAQRCQALDARYSTHRHTDGSCHNVPYHMPILSVDP